MHRLHTAMTETLTLEQLMMVGHHVALFVYQLEAPNLGSVLLVCVQQLVQYLAEQGLLKPMVPRAML